MKRTILILCALCAIISLRAADLVGTTHRDTILGVPCQVYLPSDYQYEMERGVKRGFPCLYLQHGMFGCEDDWLTSGNLLHWMDSLLREEMVAPMVIIMPDNFLGSIPPEERAQLMAAPNVDPSGKPFSTERCSQHWRKLTRDQEQAYEQSGYWEEHFGQFMTECERKYFLDSRSKHRAIAGLSMGGYHTMHVSHYVFGAFDYIGLFSPVIFPPEGATSPAYTDWQTDLRQLAQMPPLYYIAIGRTDFLYEPLQEYRKWLDSNSVEYTYYETEGGHSWANWQDYICHFLKCCFTRLW